MTAIRVATRRSTLARTQSQWVADRLVTECDCDCRLVEIDSYGDRDQSTPLAELPQVGAFTKALQDALLSGAADIAVHSLKDLPTQPAQGLTIAAIPVREDPRDVLVSNGGETLESLADGARVGTGAPRRELQLLERRPDLDVVAIRGNVDTRLSKVADGDYDATVLALAGLRRLGRADEASEILDFLPAPGQGALAIECRSDASALVEVLGALQHGPTAITVETERAWLEATGGGCRTSAAAWGRLDGDRLGLEWFLDGRRGIATGPVSERHVLAATAAREALA